MISSKIRLLTYAEPGEALRGTPREEPLTPTYATPSQKRSIFFGSDNDKEVDMVDRQFEEARKSFSKMEAFVKSMHKAVGSSNKAFMGNAPLSIYLSGHGN